MANPDGNSAGIRAACAELAAELMMLNGTGAERASVKSRQRLLILTEFLPPDFGAVGHYSLVDAQIAAAEGWQVCLVGLNSTRSWIELRPSGPGHLTIHRIRRRLPNRGALLRRSVWTLFSNLALIKTAMAELRTADRVIVHSAPPFLFEFIAVLRWCISGALVYRLGDLHPECAIAGAGTITRRLLEPLRWLAIRLRRRADCIETVGEAIRERLIRDGVEPDRVVVRRDSSPVCIDDSVPSMQKPAGLEKRPIILYSGTWGRAHDVDTWIAGYIAHHHHGSGRVVLWLNAVGDGADQVERALRVANVPVHRTTPVSLENWPSLLVTADAHLITQAAGFAELALPSKVYAAIATQGPILFIGCSDSDVHRLCRDRVGYARADLNDHVAVASALEQIAARWDESFGASGRAGQLVQPCP